MMISDKLLEVIDGWASVLDWFGYSPNFHDSEVMGMQLFRKPSIMTVSIHLWRTDATRLDELGYFFTDLHAVVTFTLHGVSSVNLNNWNHQNVLSRIRFATRGPLVVMSLEGTYGVDGEIVADSISASLTPFTGE